MIKFIKSANYVDQYFEDKRNQFCFVGRSNVGKSSLINALANQKIAKTSSTPGHTKLVNFFDFDKYVLVDLPGYGYSKSSHKDSEMIQNLINEYLCWSKKLVCVFQLCNIDIITHEDKLMSAYLNDFKKNYNIDHFVLLTKSDRVNKSHFDNNKQKIANFLNITIYNLIPISSKNKSNITKLNSIISGINQKYSKR